MKEQYCLVTGCTKGLGLSLVKELKANGKKVIGVARDELILNELTRQDLIDHSYLCDLSDDNQVNSLIDQIKNDDRSIGLFIHNAAIQYQYDMLETKTSLRKFSIENTVNYLSPVRITTALLPKLIHWRTKLVFVNSILQIGPKKSAPGYCASKTALASWVSSFRAQAKNLPISITEVVPGLIKTNMTLKASEDGIEPDILAKEILGNLQKEQLVLRGAKFPWFLGQHFPLILKKILLHT